MTTRKLQKEVILFVHGFGSSSKCWEQLIGLLNTDERIISRYDLATWDYPTKWINMNLFGRIPRLKEIGRALHDVIDSPRYRNKRLTLIGHSQGGLVIQSYFASLLEEGKAPLLRRIRQAILIATPNKGSTTGINLRLLFSTFFRNPQETTLRVLNPDVADMRSMIYKRIVTATDDTDLTWRIPVHAISGLEDNIVPEASAKGSFDSTKSFPGTHFSVIKPKNHNDKRYTEFVEFLLDPGGHRHRYEIQSYETVIRVEPKEMQTIRTKSKNPRSVEFDNYSTIKRTVQFAPSNQCKKKFTISYSTRSDGYLIAHMSHKNEAPPNQAGLGEDYGTYCQFDFTPESGQEFCLKVEIFKGFDKGNRNVHFHLLNNSHFRRLRYEVDLTPYVTSGYEINQGPNLYFYPNDIEHGMFCSNRKLGKPIPPISTSSQGLYTWEVNDIYEGVVDIIWDVKKKSINETVIANEPGT